MGMLTSCEMAGWGIVTQEFCERKWRVASIDCAEWSNATIRKDILSFKPEEDLQFVPDFIWASPPCETYSNLAGTYEERS
jgi:site-specific DNA-cytosine methylase